MKWAELMKYVKGTFRELRGDVVEIRSGDDLVFSNDYAVMGLSRRMIQVFAKRLEGRRLRFSHGEIVSVEKGAEWRGLENVGSDDIVVELGFSSESSSKVFFVTAVLAEDRRGNGPSPIEGMEVKNASGVVYGNPKENFEIRNAKLVLA